jgi:Tfp pilus assembly protein PilO
MNLNLVKGPVKITHQPVLKSTQFSVFEAALLLIFIGLFYWFIVSPKQAKVAMLNENLQKLEAEYEKQNIQVEDLKKSIKVLNSHPKEVAFLDEALPISSRVTHFPILMNEIANGTGVTTGDINIDPRLEVVYASNIDLIKNPFSITRTLKKVKGSGYFIGTFSQIKALLKKIEENGRLIEVTSVNIAASTDNKLDFRIEFEAYIYE